MKILVCDTQARTGILLSHMALEHLQTWQDYGTNTMYIKQTAIPLCATQKHKILPGRKVIIKAILDRSIDEYSTSYICHQYFLYSIVLLNTLQLVTGATGL